MYLRLACHCHRLRNQVETGGDGIDIIEIQLKHGSKLCAKVSSIAATLPRKTRNPTKTLNSSFHFLFHNPYITLYMQTQCLNRNFPTAAYVPETRTPKMLSPEPSVYLARWPKAYEISAHKTCWVGIYGQFWLIGQMAYGLVK